MRIQSKINADFEFSTKSQHLLSSISAFHVPLDGGRQTLTVSGCKQLVQRLGQHIHHKRMWWLAFPVEFFLCLLRRGGKKKCDIAHIGLQLLTNSRGNKRTQKIWQHKYSCGLQSHKMWLRKNKSMNVLSVIFTLYTTQFCFVFNNPLNLGKGVLVTASKCVLTCSTALSSYRSVMLFSRLLQMRTSLRATLIPPPVRGCLML